MTTLYLRSDNMAVEPVIPQPGEEEIWLTIQDYEGLYEVSSFGRVRSLDRILSINYRGVEHDHYATRRGRIIKRSIRASYNSVMIWKRNEFKNLKASRLVCAAFHPNPDNLPWVNHIDGIKTNDYYKNLEWVTPDDNLVHAINHGLVSVKRTQVVDEKTGVIIGEYRSMTKAAKSVSLHQSRARLVVDTGRPYKGYLFQTPKTI